MGKYAWRVQQVWRPQAPRTRTVSTQHSVFPARKSVESVSEPHAKDLVSMALDKTEQMLTAAVSLKPL